MSQNYILHSDVHHLQIPYLDNYKPLMSKYSLHLTISKRLNIAKWNTLSRSFENNYYFLLLLPIPMSSTFLINNTEERNLLSPRSSHNF